MRDYPSVPNVFRVASSHSINNEGTGTSSNSNSNNTYAPAAAGISSSTKTTARGAGAGGGTAGSAGNSDAIGINSNMPPRNLQQQLQQQQLQQNGIITNQQKQQQQLKQKFKNSLAAASTEVISTIATTTAPAAKTSVAAATSTSELQQQQPQQQQQFYHNGIIMQTNPMLQQQKLLTTSASIERNYYNATATPSRTRDQQQLLQQHTPYATLPRTISAFGNGDLQKPQQQQQQPHNNRNNSNNVRLEDDLSLNVNVNGGNGGGIGGGRSVGLINTISGSIPSTGFATNGGHVSSIGSDLNVSLNNSCTDLTKLNGLQKHQQQQQQRDYNRVSRANGGGGGIGAGVRGNAIDSDYAKQRSKNPCTNMERNNGGYLWILTPVAASISVAIVIAALAGPQWLFTEEKLPNANYNGTANFNALDDGAFITKYTKSSLWILCTTIQGVETYNCIKIDYFPMEGYQPDPHDSTPAIPYTVTKSCPFFLASGIFLLISFIVFLIPTCSHQNNLYYFSAGIMFIVSGLLMLIGLIAYISILKAEIGSKLRSRSTLQPAMFKVNYGQSFFLFVFGFIATEFVGLLNIFLYISLQEIGYYSRLPCFTISNLQVKIKEGEYPRSHTYKSYKNTAASNDQKPMQRARHSSNNYHQVHNIQLLPAQQMELDAKMTAQLQQLTNSAAYAACRKHPNAATESNFLLNNDLERRFYFEKTPAQAKCNLHSKNLAKSLNELYTEPAPAVGPPPPPSTIKVGGTVQTLPRYQQQHHQPTHFADLPQEFPLTRSVSTTTDIYTNGGNTSTTMMMMAGNGGGGNGTASHMERKNRRNMATNTRPSDTEIMKESEMKKNAAAIIRRSQNVAMENIYMGVDNVAGVITNDNDDVDDDDEDEPQRLCGLKRGVRKTKDELFQEFCKRAGMRPKPKNIYFIANEEEAAEHWRRRCNGGGNLAAGRRNEANESREVERREEGEDVEEGERNGFKLAAADDENIYVLDDNTHFLTNPPMRSTRRSSMYIEPTHLRKLNSNLSLHTLYPPPSEKLYQKSLLDLDRCDSSTDIWSPYPEIYYNRNAYGGSQNRLHADYNSQIYQSRTLPRSFQKRNSTTTMAADSQDNQSIGPSSLHASASALHNIYSPRQNRLTNLMLQHQQQLQQQNRYLSQQSRDIGVCNSAMALHKSCENINTQNYVAAAQQIAGGNVRATYVPATVPTSINTGNAAANHKQSNTLQQPTVQWPAAIPSSPSNFPANYQIYAAAHAPHLAHAFVTRSASGGDGCSRGVHVPTGLHKFQRAYAFDEQRRSSTVCSDAAFDLDEIERERRRSHASLFGGGGGVGMPSLAALAGSNSAEHYDLINGTAV